MERLTFDTGAERSYHEEEDSSTLHRADHGCRVEEVPAAKTMSTDDDLGHGRTFINVDHRRPLFTKLWGAIRIVQQLIDGFNLFLMFVYSEKFWYWLLLVLTFSH